MVCWCTGSALIVDIGLHCSVALINDFTFHRQLEAIIRISESLAKMRLSPFATEADVDEALRLFQVSTLDAAMSGNLAGLFCSCGILGRPNLLFLFSYNTDFTIIIISLTLIQD